MGPHLETTLVTPITQASRIPLSNQDSEFISTMAPTHPNMAVQSTNWRKTWKMQTGWCFWMAATGNCENTFSTTESNYAVYSCFYISFCLNCQNFLYISYYLFYWWYFLFCHPLCCCYNEKFLIVGLIKAHLLSGSNTPCGVCSDCIPCICWWSVGSVSWSEPFLVWCGWACGWAVGCAPGGPSPWACDPGQEAL